MQSDAKRSLAIFRYAILLIGFNSFIVCLMAPVILTSNPNINANITFGDTLVPALFTAFASVLVGIAAYFVYVQLLQKSIGKKKQDLYVG